MRQAFIVYAPSERQLAVRLWDELRWHGLDVGIDLQDAPPHLERSAVLEDVVFQCELLLLILGKNPTAEVRRLHLLAIEQDLNIIAVERTADGIPPLPDALRVPQTVVMGNHAVGLKHILRFIPDAMLNRAPDEDQILANLHHKNPNVRRTTLYMAAKDRLHIVTQSAMSLMLSDDNVEVRAAAAYALDKINNVEATAALIEALNDRSFDVRSNAGWALVNLGRRRDSPASRAVTGAVIDVLRDGENEDTREMAYLVLTRLGGKEALEAIRKYWQ